MDKQLPSQLSKNETIQAYLILLNMLGNVEKKKDTMELINHIEELEQKFDTVIGEIKELRHTIEQLQNPSTRLNLKTMIDKVDTSVQHGKNRLLEVKETFINSVQSYMNSLKDVGKNTTVKTLDLLHINQGLKKVHQSLSFSMASLNYFNSRVNQITTELRKAKVNFKNVGLLMRGKTTNYYNVDKAKLNLLQRVGKSVLSSMEKLQTTVYNTSNKISNLDKGSVKKDLKLLETQKKESVIYNDFMKSIKDLPR